MSIVRLLYVKARVGLQLTSAYIGELWIGIFSAVTYGMTYVLLLHFIFELTPSIGGYNRTEMFLLMLVGQIGFYLLSFWSFAGNERMIEYVNNGNLDFLLLKPVSPLWNIATERVAILDSVIRLVFLIPLYAMFIDWSQVSIEWWRLPIAIVIMLIGLFVEHVIHFLISVTAFWFGDSRSIQYLIYGLSTQRIPYEAMPGWFKGVFTIVIPTYITSSVVVSALLGKTNSWWLLFITGIVGVVFYMLKLSVWKAALKVYSSASS